MRFNNHTLDIVVERRRCHTIEDRRMLIECPFVVLDGRLMNFIVNFVKVRKYRYDINR